MIEKLRQWLADLHAPNLRLLAARDEHLLQRLTLHESWMKNMDAALFKLSGTDDPAAIETMRTDYKQLADGIRKEIEAKKVSFPTRVEDLAP